MKLKNGDVLRLRYITHVDTDGATQAGYRPPEASNRRDEKQVFVVLLLGTEPLVIDDETNQGKELDVHSALRQLGWYSENSEDEEEIERLEAAKEERPKQLRLRKKSPLKRKT
jgi:hypothetical protein